MLVKYVYVVPFQVECSSRIVPLYRVDADQNLRDTSRYLVNYTPNTAIDKIDEYD